MENKNYIIYDRIAGTWISYPKGMFSSDCWTTIRRCANRYTFKQALFEKKWISKVCHIKTEDLVIMEI